MNFVLNIISFVIAALFAWAFQAIVLDSDPPVVVESSVMVLSKQPIARNDVLKIQYKVTPHRACTGTGQRVFTDAGGTQLPATAFATNTAFRGDGSPTVFDVQFDDVVQVTVPAGAAPGPATYVNETVYYCNFWQRVTHRGIHFRFPVVDFAVGQDSLPAVVPSTSMFRSRRTQAIGDWVREHVWWAKDD